MYLLLRLLLYEHFDHTLETVGILIYSTVSYKSLYGEPVTVARSFTHLYVPLYVSVTLLLYLYSLHPGIVLYYGLLQLALWWFFHVLTLFWKIKFPLHAKAVESAHQMRYVHLTMVILGLTLPLVPVIASLATTGFGLNRFPAILCGGTNANITFYALLLPVILLLQVGITLLVVLFWTIHKVCIYYSLLLSAHALLSHYDLCNTKTRGTLIYMYMYVI